MSTIYEECKTYENEKIRIRPVEITDATAYLSIYSDKKAQPFFNCDNYEKPCYFSNLEEMENEILFYLRSYKEKDFVRWSVIDKESSKVVGSVEIFLRKSNDYFNDVALLRMDLRSDYEEYDFLFSLLSFIHENVCNDFHTNRIATKAIPKALNRRLALENLGYEEKKEALIGHKKERYENYFEWVSPYDVKKKKLNKINVVCLGVADMEKAMKFYKDGLGFFTKEEDYHAQIVFFTCGNGLEFSLYPIDELALDIDNQNPPKRGEGFSGVTLAYNANSKEEVDELMNLAIKAGATLAKKPQEVFWGGYSGYFMDFDGFYWEIAYNPEYTPNNA